MENTAIQVAPNADTGEIVTSPVKTYDGISAHPLSKEQREILQTETPRELVKLRPDGMAYVDNIQYRKRLDDAFGVGGWSLKPISSTMQPGTMSTKNGPKEIIRVFVLGQLWCEGRFVSESVGEDVYYPDNGNDSYATAWEKAKSNLLVRCSKELGLFRELWDRDWLTGSNVNGGSAPSGKKPYPRKAVMENAAPLESVTGRVKGVTSKEMPGKDGKAPYKLYTIELEDDGAKFTTFKRDLSAKCFKSIGKDMIFEIQANGNYEPKLLNISEA